MKIQGFWGETPFWLLSFYYLLANLFLLDVGFPVLAAEVPTLRKLVLQIILVMPNYVYRQATGLGSFPAII